MDDSANGIDGNGHHAVIASGAYVFAWALAVLAIALSITGSLLNWYRFGWFDEAIHAYFSFAATLLVSLYLYRDLLGPYRHHGVVLVCTVICVGLGLGVFWEWGEWFYDRFSGPANAIYGKTDTLGDLAMDALGALAAGLLMLVMLRR